MNVELEEYVTSRLSEAEEYEANLKALKQVQLCACIDVHAFSV